MFRDGIDPRPLTVCPAPCRDCGRACRKADIDAAIRDEGWIPIDDAPLCGTGWVRGAWAISTNPTRLEVLTVAGTVALATYRADGDYADRWQTERGYVLNVTHWRVPRPRLH